MERQSNLHSPRVDEEMQHEVESLTRGSPVEARIEESRLMEDAGDGEPVAQAIVGELQDAEGGDEIAGGLSRGEVIGRSELAIHLRPSIFPAGRDAILECAEEEHAPADLLGQLRALPHGSYANVQEVWEALGGKREEGSGHVVQEDPHAREDGEAQQKPPEEDAPEEQAPEAEAPEAEVPEAETPEENAPEIEPLDEPEPLEPVAAPSTVRFGFRFDPWYRLAALPFGVSPSSASVTVEGSPDQRVLVARFGPWSVTTPVENVAGTTVTGPYSPVKTIGPAHVSLSDLGLTFATNREQGLCIRFLTSVPGIAPTGLLRHPALTVTVEDPEELARMLAA